MCFPLLGLQLLFNVIIISHMSQSCTPEIYLVSPLHLAFLGWHGFEIIGTDLNLTSFNSIGFLFGRWILHVLICWKVPFLLVKDVFGWEKIEFVSSLSKAIFYNSPLPWNRRFGIWVTCSVAYKVFVMNSTFSSMLQYTSFEMSRAKLDLTILISSNDGRFYIICITTCCRVWLRE